MGSSDIIDYIIGKSNCLRGGFGKMVVADLTKRIALHHDTKQFVVQPEPKNKASCGLLLSRGYALCMETEIYEKLLP